MESTTQTQATNVEFETLLGKFNRQLEYYRDGWAHPQLSREAMAKKLLEMCDRIEEAAGTSFLLNARAKAAREQVNRTLATETAAIVNEVQAVFGKCAIEDEDIDHPS